VLAGLFLISTVVQFRFGKRERSFNMRRWAFLPVGFVVSLVSGIIAHDLYHAGQIQLLKRMRGGLMGAGS